MPGDGIGGSGGGGGGGGADGGGGGADGGGGGADGGDGGQPAASGWTPPENCIVHGWPCRITVTAIASWQQSIFCASVSPMS